MYKSIWDTSPRKVFRTLEIACAHQVKKDMQSAGTFTKKDLADYEAVIKEIER